MSAKLLYWASIPAIVLNAQVTIDPPPAILIDQNGIGTGTVMIRNSGTAATLRLASDQWMRSFQGAVYPLPATTTFAPLALADKAAVEGTAPMNVQSLAVRVTVTGVTEAGKSTARLTDGGVPIRCAGCPHGIAELTAVRLPLAYNATLDAKGAPKAEVIQGPSHASTVRLANADASPYLFTWRVRINGNEQPATGAPAQVNVPANGAATLDLSRALPYPAQVSGWGDWTVAWLGYLLSAGTLKDNIVSAELVLYPEFGGAPVRPQAPQVLPLNVRQRFWRDGVQEAINTICLFLLLALGGIAAIWVYCGMPNTTKALAIRRRLSAAKARIKGLGSDIDSRWRVLLASQRTRLRARLFETWWIFPSFATVLESLTKEVAMFEGWVQCAYNASLVVEAANDRNGGPLPPTVYKWILQRCHDTLKPIESGFTTAEEEAAMHASCAKGRELLVAARNGTPIPDLEARIAARESEAAAGAAALVQMFPGLQKLIEEVVAVAGTPVTTADYMQRDCDSLKVEMLSDVRRIVVRLPALRKAQTATGESAPDPAEERREQLMGNVERLAESLEAESVDALAASECIRDQIICGVYNDMLAAQFQQSAISVTVAPTPIIQGEPTRMSICFNQSRLSGAAARSEFVCEWDFGDGSAPEQGWDVFHAYGKAGTYAVAANISSFQDTSKALATATRTLEVLGGRQREGNVLQRLWLWFSPETVLEASRLALVLVTAVIGLLATAQQQIESMTLLQATGIALGLGFGAGTLKNLIADKSS